jgi:transcriptional regulator with XRE-family HTH domain
MSIEPMERLYKAFGNVLVRRRRERKWTAYALATAAGMSESEVIGLELGEYGPTLKDFFRIANAFGEEPTILFIGVVAAWRGDSNDPLYKSRATDFTRIYRLGYYHDHGDFRELPRAYGHMDEATGAARTLNAARQSKGLPPLNTVLIYVRLGSAGFRSDAREQP